MFVRTSRKGTEGSNEMKGSRTPVKPSACFPAWASAGKARDALRADHPNLQLPHTTIRFWSGFSDDQWLCCSLFGANAHFSRHLPPIY